MKLSLIIPTYNEKENIPKLLLKLREEFSKNNIDAEIIAVDDNSPDGTGQVLEELRKEYPNLKVIHRSGKLGLSSAVTAGFARAEGDILGVMDADLSHPPEKISEIYEAAKDADLVIGSRYIKGGKIEGWNAYRKIMSKGATLLARFFTSVSDPMSGFFLVKRGHVADNREINPKGFKILLEILVKTDCKNIKEVPIVFTNRAAGVSKAGIREIVYYLRNLAGYLPYKKEVIHQFFKFAFVGFTGTIINITILYILTEYLHIYYIISALIAIGTTLITNFIGNKIWTFHK